MDITELGVEELARRLAAKDLSSVEVVDATLAHLHQCEPKLNAFITVMDDEARAAARQADDERAQGRARGPLHGVPVSLKDMFATAGVRTTGASGLLAGWVPDFDAALVERLRAAGAIIIGKTNQDEFGHGGTSTLSHFGPVHNPWDVGRVAGGSSGGSTAAVAAGIGPLSYGTETGSSVRRPSAYCGIFGIKPTFGVISRFGSFRGAWSMDHVGVFTRDVRDAALGLDAAAGHDPRDPASVPLPPAAYTASLAPRVERLRVGVLTRFVEDQGVDEPVRQAFTAAAEVLRGLGGELVELHVPELEYAAMTSMITSSAEAAANNVRWLRERAGEFVTEVRRRLSSGLAITAPEYLTVQRARYRIREAVRRSFDDVDILLSPVGGREAPPIEAGPRGSGDRPWQVGTNPSNLLRFPSMLGLPACSIPCGFGAEGMPIGLQIVGPWFEDQRVLDVALAYQQASDWLTRRPRRDTYFTRS